jgi:hypothetical protein
MEYECASCERIQEDLTESEKYCSEMERKFDAIELVLREVPDINDCVRFAIKYVLADQASAK